MCNCKYVIVNVLTCTCMYHKGAGGEEASLFATEMLKLYTCFAEHKGWQFELLERSHSDVGGLKSASASVHGNGVFGVLKYEAGVHRVQRVPSTDAKGRIHTSTVTVATLPQPTEVECSIQWVYTWVF